MNTAHRKTNIYVDGTCRNNGRPGAIRGCDVHQGPSHQHNVSEILAGQKHTSNRAEISAANNSPARNRPSSGRKLYNKH